MSTSKKFSATRPYQIEARKALQECYGRNSRALLCLPTQSGKTWTALKFLQENNHLRDHVVFWTAHLDELLGQAESTHNSFSPESGTRTLYWNAKSKPNTSQFVPGDLVFTQIQSTRTFKYKKSHPTILVVDETHREAAKTYRNFEAAVSPDWKMGLTATPYRLDKEDLGYDEIAYQKTLLQLAADGWLAKPRYVKVSTERRYDLKIAGDFTKASMEALGKDLCRIETVAAHYIDNRQMYGQTVIFAPSTGSAEAISDVLRMNGVNAAFLTGKTDKLLRDTVVRDFKNRKLQVLVNVQLFTEGFSSDIRTVMLARPTLSKTLWLQAVGRGAGISDPLIPPCDDYFYVVDFVDNVNMYPMVAEEFSVQLLGASKSSAYVAREQEKEAVKNLKKRNLTKEEEKLVDQARRKGKVLSILGYMRICNTFKSGKEGQYVSQTYPIFREELPYFVAMLEHIKDAKQNGKDLYTLIQSSYERGGNQTNLTRVAWKDVCWRMSQYLDGLRVFGRPVFETKYFLQRPTITPDKSLIDMSEPLRGREELIKAKIGEASKRYGTINLARISHSTIFVTVDNPRGYYWKGTINNLKETLTQALGMAIEIQKV